MIIIEFQGDGDSNSNELVIILEFEKEMVIKDFENERGRYNLYMDFQITNC